MLIFEQKLYLILGFTPSPSHHISFIPGYTTIDIATKSFMIAGQQFAVFNRTQHTKSKDNLTAQFPLKQPHRDRSIIVG